ncbi:hypothetical protein FS837_006609 [Tulasnella sp. UAMH 9824]|nr:hypothetical protein FS837_006609 [Tulasnella sp. UAMH 9824]
MKYSDVLGRPYASQSAIYDLPADSQEHKRMDLQHAMLKALVDGLYVPPDLVRKALDPTQRHNKCSVLDVGTGSGIWAVEMAREFPSADVVGMDMVNPANAIETPPNCRFEIGDANLDWGRYAEAFNVVHMRSIASGIKDFKALLRNVAQTLRPEGVILLVSPTHRVYSETKESLEYHDEATPGWSAMAALNEASKRATLKRGGTSATASDYWTELLADIPFYTNVGEKEFWIPIGPWKEGMNESERTAAELLRQNAIAILSAFKPRLLEGGYDEALLDRWSLIAKKELQEMEPKLCMLWKFAWATRSPEPWSPL